MKLNQRKRFALLLFAVLSAVGAGAARGGPRPHEGSPEMQAYVQAKVLPVVRQQRQKLEARLAPADRAQLAAYRTQLQSLKAQGQALRQSLRAATTSGGTRAEPTEAQREQLHRLRLENRALLQGVAQVAQKYEAPLRALAEEMQSQKEKWAADVLAIAVKNATPEQGERLAAHGGHPYGYHGLHRLFRPTQFLLMEATAPAEARPAERELGRTSFYPNPATATSRLEYEVKKTGPVTVELLDQNGTKLRTLAAETTPATGLRTQPLDLHDLPAGTYYCKITTKSGSETKRFVKE